MKLNLLRKEDVLMKLKMQRNGCIISGICFLLGIILSNDKFPSVYYILNTMNSTLMFVAAYKIHKKIID